MLLGAYVFYLVVSIAITVWVGNSLHKNGRVFLVEVFRGREEIADSVNHLLLVGFYLINIGFVTLAMKYGDQPRNIEGVFEFLSVKIGLVMLILGMMHFFNVSVLTRFRDSRLFKGLAPVVAE